MYRREKGEEEMYDGKWIPEMRPDSSVKFPTASIRSFLHNKRMVSKGDSISCTQLHAPSRAWREELLTGSSYNLGEWFSASIPVQSIREEDSNSSSCPSLYAGKFPSSLQIKRPLLLPEITKGGAHLLYSLQECHNDASSWKPLPECSTNSSKQNPSEKLTASNIYQIKVRKEKLSGRISALQQLVSPFGKTDTASVLLDATEYIKCLHDQVTVLCTPYMNMDHGVGRGGGKQDLTSKGLCLVPISNICNVTKDHTKDLLVPKFGVSH